MGCGASKSDILENEVPADKVEKMAVADQKEETPKEAPKETPVEEAPKEEAPKEEAPKEEEPKPEEPKPATKGVISTEEFDKLEDEIRSLINEGGREKALELWNQFDYNGSGQLSLAEIDKQITEQYPLLNNTDALIRAFYFTTVGRMDTEAYKKANGEDAYVQLNEFMKLLRNIFYFNKLWSVFDDIDTDDDRRVTEDEFVAGVDKAGLDLSSEDARAKFKEIDTNNGGVILFDEFVQFVAEAKIQVD
ncbi:EF-hand domain pair [Carpediemonas membranifera]|uniref:EF-hand domain pair n=1 Tax=Carpediemonas membranifera TaxID=201153 RepID=A0A8J6E0Q1_9EUKA|nr:EF-hand domain pair [Carpediemonas membranifera]|eukprot:KAG9392126.1 EF-hand domain pair [Carpediemonas membranifera]